MRLLTLIVLLLLAPAVLAGTVRTLDGKSYDGDVKLENGQLVVNQKRGLPAVKLDLSDVLQADFKTAEPPREAPVLVTNLDKLWKMQDVGPTGTAGSVRFVDGRYAVKGAGANIKGVADSFYFVYQELRGDGQIVARLSDLQIVNPYEKAGVMIRADFNERDSKTAFLFLTPQDGSSFAARDTKGGEMKASPLAGERPPTWLRLTRIRNTITAYKAAEGGGWQQVGDPVEIRMEARVFVGLAVCSRDTNTACAATFEGVIVQPGIPREDPPPRLAPGGGIDTGRGNPGPMLNRAVVLRSGSVIGNVQIQSANDKTVQIVRSDGKPVSLASADVARLILAPVTAQQLAKIPPQGSGVLLGKGDFMDGEFESLERGRVKTSSVLFGPSSLAAGSEAVVVVLHEIGAATSSWVVRTSEGFVYMARSLKVDKDQLLVEDETAGTIKVPTWGLVEVKAGGGRFDSLTDTKPTKIDVTPGLSAATAYTTIAGVQMTVGGQPCDRGLACQAGASLTYVLDGKYKVFLGRAGIPDGIVPALAVRFVVSVDGKEVYRSPPRTSIDDATVLSLNVSGAKTLTLRVENAGNLSLPVTAVWVDPALVK